MLRALLYRLELRGGDLWFHDIECIPRFAQDQALNQQVATEGNVSVVHEYSVKPKDSDTLDVTLLIGETNYGVDISATYVSIKRVDIKLEPVDRVYVGIKYTSPDTLTIPMVEPNASNDLPSFIITQHRPKFSLAGIRGLLRCPLYDCPLIDPVILSNGKTYDVSSIQEYSAMEFDKLTWKSISKDTYARSLCIKPPFKLYKNNIIKQICEVVFSGDTDSDDCVDNQSALPCQTLTDIEFTYLDRLREYKIQLQENPKTIVVKVIPYTDRIVDWKLIKQVRKEIKSRSDDVNKLSAFAREYLNGYSADNFAGDNEIKNMHADMRLPNFKRASYSGTDMSFLDLSDVIISNLRFDECAFHCTNFTNADFDRCKFKYCNFAGAIFTNCQFTDCEFYSCEMKYKCVDDPMYTDSNDGIVDGDDGDSDEELPPIDE